MMISPIGSSAQRVINPSVGSLRFNINLSVTEYWNGSGWISAKSLTEPKTVWEWLEKFVFEQSVESTSAYSLDAWINCSMQQLFPGEYVIEYRTGGGGVDGWNFEFATPEHETLFWLKYA